MGWGTQASAAAFYVSYRNYSVAASFIGSVPVTAEAEIWHGLYTDATSYAPGDTIQIYGSAPDSVSLSGRTSFTLEVWLHSTLLGGDTVEDFSYLADLCDPLHMNDVSTTTLCELTPDHEDKEGFVQYFATGRIVGEVEYIEGVNDAFACVNFLYGPNGDLTETMELILRDGLWYLLDM